MSNYRKTMTEALQEMYSLDESVIDKVKEIASKKAAKKIDGVMVDSFTASAISQIYDKVNDANKKKMEKLPITKLADLAFKMMQKNEFVPEEVDLDEKVKEYKGVAYFKDLKDAEAHMKKYAPKGRIREYDRGYAIQTKIAGPYLNKSGKTEEADLDEASARADARRSMRADPDMRQKFSKDVSATDDDIKGASKNIMMQMRKAQSLGRGMGDPKRKFKVEFGDGKKVEIPVKVAMAVQQKFNSMRKPADKEKFQSKVAKSYKDMLRALKEEVELDETKYDLYHKDFSSAMQHAYKMAKKLHGITVDPKEIDDKVASGPRKPSSGKTNSYRLKGDKGAIQVQVANLDNKRYELNMYKEEVEVDESKRQRHPSGLRNVSKGAFPTKGVKVSPHPIKGKSMPPVDARGRRKKKEEVELDEIKEPFVVVDTADGNKVVATASDEKGAKSSIASAELPPMKIKDKKTLKIMKSKKKQMIGQPFKEEVEVDEQLAKIKGKTPADDGRRAAVEDDIERAKKKGDKKLVKKLKERILLDKINAKVQERKNG